MESVRAKSQFDKSPAFEANGDGAESFGPLDWDSPAFRKAAEAYRKAKTGDSGRATGAADKRSAHAARRVVRCYDYHDADRAPLLQVRRWEPKDFTQHRADGNGGWEPKAKGAKRVPYRLPELLASDDTELVFVVEGEKDADRLRACGLVATTNPGGAGKWGRLDPEAVRKAFVGREVVLLPDRDGPGEEHAAQVLESLRAVAVSVRVVRLPDHKDVSDWLAAGHDADELLALVWETKPSAGRARPAVRLLTQLRRFHRERLEAGDSVINESENGWECCCPAHDDNRPSLSVRKDEDNGKLVLHCHADCTAAQVVASLGMETKDLFAGPAAPPPPSSNVGLEVCGGDELMRKELPPARSALPGLIPEGVAILAGKPKSGKSWFMLDVALAVAEGGDVLGGLRGEEGDVLYLAMEDSDRRLQERIRKLRPGRPVSNRFVRALHSKPFLNGGREAILAQLERMAQPRLLVIDTLQKIRSRRSGKSANPYADDYEDVAAIKALADLLRLPVVVIHHTNKGEKDDPLESVSGTLGLTGAADTILVLKHEQHSPTGTLFVTGRDVESQELAMGWDREACRWTVAGDAADLREGESTRKVRELLVEEGRWMPIDEVAALLELKRDTAKTILYRLRKQRKIEGHSGQFRARGSAADPSSTPNS